MKKHLLLVAFALIVFSAAPAMAGKKMSVRIWGQDLKHEVQWSATTCDCVTDDCDTLPGGKIRVHDMWPDGEHQAAVVESKDYSSGGDTCATAATRIAIVFKNLSDPNDTTKGVAQVGKYSGWNRSHWVTLPGQNTKDITVSYKLTEGSTDNLDIRLTSHASQASKQPAAPSKAVDTNSYYRLTTQFRGDGESLEGNRADSPVHDGAAFMDKRQNVSGQLWKLVPEGDWFRLKTQFQGNDHCLEGNRADSPVHDGAAFMDTCQNVSGQLWKLVPEGDWFRLKTRFQGNDRCLEGNRADSPVHDGAAFMDTCQNVSGQLWKLEQVK